MKIYFYGSIPLFLSSANLPFITNSPSVLHSILSLTIFISFFFLNFTVIYELLKLCEYLLMHEFKLCTRPENIFIIIRIFLYWICTKDCHMFKTFSLSSCSEFFVLEAGVYQNSKNRSSWITEFLHGPISFS